MIYPKVVEFTTCITPLITHFHYKCPSWTLV